MSYNFETIQKTMLLNARRIPPTPAKPRIILLAIDDIAEKREMQQKSRLVWNKRYGNGRGSLMSSMKS